MIHLLAWTAVVLQAAHSYNHRRHLDPHGVLEHKAGLPTIGFAILLMFILSMLIHWSGAGGYSEPAVWRGQQTIWVPLT